MDLEVAHRVKAKATEANLKEDRNQGEPETKVRGIKRMPLG